MIKKLAMLNTTTEYIPQKQETRAHSKYYPYNEKVRSTETRTVEFKQSGLLLTKRSHNCLFNTLFGGSISVNMSQSLLKMGHSSNINLNESPYLVKSLFLDSS